MNTEELRVAALHAAALAYMGKRTHRNAVPAVEEIIDDAEHFAFYIRNGQLTN